VAALPPSLVLAGSCAHTLADCLRAVASAHVFLYLLDGKPVSSTLPGSQALSAASATGASAGSSKSAAKHKQREQQQQQQAGPLVSKGAAAAPTSGNSGSSSSSSSSSRQQGGSDKEAVSERQQRREADWQSTLATSARLMESLYPEFTRQAERQGWKLSQVSKEAAAHPTCISHLVLVCWGAGNLVRALHRHYSTRGMLCLLACIGGQQCYLSQSLNRLCMHVLMSGSMC
jgi:hypothetical protein